MDSVQQQDIAEFAAGFELAGELSGAVFLITGATGHIGSSLIHCLLALKKGVRIMAPVRQAAKACRMFSEAEMEQIQLIECDITTCDYDTLGVVDYIIHCAAPTASGYFVSHPVETFDAICKGTQALLEFARRHPVRGFVYLSSLEIYGVVEDDSTPLTEDMQGRLDILSVRSSYPMAKRAMETLCCLYAAEYGVPVRVARLTQTIGAGIPREDNRIIAQFCRLAAEGQDIILHTAGESARPYCYVIDSVSAILYLLLRGSNGEAYNVAHEENYISVRDMARLLREHFNPGIEVRIELQEVNAYAPVTKHRLSSRKLAALGWVPRYDLFRTFGRLIEYYKG